MEVLVPICTWAFSHEVLNYLTPPPPVYNVLIIYSLESVQLLNIIVRLEFAASLFAFSIFTVSIFAFMMFSPSLFAQYNHHESLDVDLTRF